MSGEKEQMWLKLINSAQNVTIWRVLGHPFHATSCQYFINLEKKGATFCMGGSSIVMEHILM